MLVLGPFGGCQLFGHGNALGYGSLIKGVTQGGLIAEVVSLYVHYLRLTPYFLPRAVPLAYPPPPKKKSKS